MNRMISVAEWNLDNLDEVERRERLLDSTTPDDVALSLFEDAKFSAENGNLRIDWQEACEKPGYFRLIAMIPIGEIVCDRLFNGRAGYRAQFYLSPEEGVLYNRR